MRSNECRVAKKRLGKRYTGRDVRRLAALYEDGEYPTGFWVWLSGNWHVYDMFVRMAHEAKDAGYDRWSARSILHAMRWQTLIVERGASGLKLNDHCSPGLARLSMKMETDLIAFFETRTPPGVEKALRLDGSSYLEGGDE